MGEIGILNVGAGDNKLVCDKNDPAAMERFKRIVTDMIRRGYALLVETGEKDEADRPVMQRATAFDPEKCEYIIADFDSAQAAEHDAHEESSQETLAPAETTSPKPRRGRRPNKPNRERRIDAGATRAVAVPRTAGG